MHYICIMHISYSLFSSNRKERLYAFCSEYARFCIPSGQNFSWYNLSVPVQSKVNGPNHRKCPVVYHILTVPSKSWQESRPLFISSFQQPRLYQRFHVDFNYETFSSWRFNVGIWLVQNYQWAPSSIHPIVNLWLIFESLLLISLTLILSIWLI